MLSLADSIQIPASKIHALLNDAEKTAQAINLHYIQNQQAGIERVKKGDSFQYFLRAKRITHQETLERITKLVIPPAWNNVWICPLENGHLQATGTDLKGRKQYKYHALWNVLRNQTKFYRLHEFGKVIPTIRQQVEKDLSLPGMPVEKVLAAVVYLMEQTGIRVGNNIYEKLYGSFGLTTLRNKHVKIAGSKIQFVFKGKKGIAHNISIKSQRLAKIVKQCRDIPGKELFQYYDDNGHHKCIDSGMVNNYLKTITGKNFTAKDFRTWAGSLQALMAFKSLGQSEDATDRKENIVKMLDNVAKHLGNTRAVCKKYYVHPVIIDLYEHNSLQPYFKQLDKLTKGVKINELRGEEKILMKILA
jgi:DNA topoisomerase-1